MNHQGSPELLCFISITTLGGEYYTYILLFPGSLDGKESTYNTGDSSSIPGLGRSPGEGNGNSLQYSCLQNPMDRGAWWTIAHGVTKTFTSLHYSYTHFKVELTLRLPICHIICVFIF